MKHVSLAIAKMNSENFSPKKTIWYFVSMFSLSQGHLDTNTIHLSSVFTDSSKIKLKTVLLHNGNKFPSVPLAHAAKMKESYENMELLLEKIQYEKYNWNICGNLKVTALLLGLQLGYAKFCYFI